MGRTDAELVVATLEGDVDAFREIVERYQRLVFNVAYHYVGHRYDMEDLAQEVFLKLFKTLDRYDTTRPLKAWLVRITVNQCLDAVRKARSRPVKLFADLTEEDKEQFDYFLEKSARDTGLTVGEARESFRLLQKLMDRLGEKDRTAFVLREIEGISYAELAGILGTTEMAARIRVSRARKKLQDQLSEVFQTNVRQAGQV